MRRAATIRGARGDVCEIADRIRATSGSRAGETPSRHSGESRNPFAFRWRMESQNGFRLSPE
jgi:hypothetical protein